MRGIILNLTTFVLYFTIPAFASSLAVHGINHDLLVRHRPTLCAWPFLYTFLYYSILK
jgi:hypothetical protein